FIEAPNHLGGTGKIRGHYSDKRSNRLSVSSQYKKGAHVSVGLYPTPGRSEASPEYCSL
ncbi:hypothetical protein E4U54_007030, partial [Claviceps lovelessii]